MAHIQQLCNRITQALNLAKANTVGYNDRKLLHQEVSPRKAPESLPSGKKSAA
jgi:hypothetical protein